MIETSRSGDILEIRMARPPVNALNPELLDALRAAVQSAPGDGVRGLILGGGPSVFSAGLDVPYLLTLERDDLAAAWHGFFECARAIARSPIPVAAAIGGHSPAGGCVLALCCDYRVMAQGPFRIGLNEVEVGVVVPDGIQHLLRRVVGPYRAERLMVSGTMVESEHALAIHLVDETAEIEHVSLRARIWLEDLLAKPSAPMLATRRLARADLVAALDDPQRMNIDRFIDDWFSPETQSVLQAMVARLKAGKASTPA